jgi:hypothetical protein
MGRVLVSKVARRALALALLLAVVGMAPSEAAAPSAGAVRGKHWTLYDLDTRFGRQFVATGHLFGLQLTGNFRFGGRAWQGTVPMRLLRGQHMFDPNVTTNVPSFDVTNATGHRLRGSCSQTGWSSPVLATVTTRVVLACTASIDDGRVGGGKLRVDLSYVDPESGEPTYDPAIQWYKGKPTNLVGTFVQG